MNRFEELPRRWRTTIDVALIAGLLLTTAWVYTDLPMVECAWCHQRTRLQRHHVVPQAVNLELVNVETNLVVLCSRCHFCLGHRCNYHVYNPDVLEIVQRYTNCFPICKPCQTNVITVTNSQVGYVSSSVNSAAADLSPRIEP